MLCCFMTGMGAYRVLNQGILVESDIPGLYAGWKTGKIFGTLDCRSGVRMKKENRVFFLCLEDAVSQGYRPCKVCKPLDGVLFQKIRLLVPQYGTLEEFYERDCDIR